MNNTLKKYKLGLLALGLLTLGLLVMLLVQASATKADKTTYAAATKAAEKLNTFYSSDTVPSSLEQAGVKNPPSSLSYTRLSDTSYKFCATYKTTSSNFDAQSTLLNLATGNAAGSNFNSGGDSSYLVVDSAHKKGTNCQTVTINNYSNFTNFTGTQGGNPLSGLLDVQTKSQDSERKTDIASLQAHLEAYYATNGHYPVLANVNSSVWRATNMTGLDSSALCDPSQGVTGCSLVAVPVKGAYSYGVRDASNQTCATESKCISYTLTATLTTGESFSKSSL